MTIKTAKIKAVETEKWCTEKEFKKATIRLFICVGFIALTLITLCVATVGFAVALLVGLACGVLFVSLDDFMVESKESFDMLSKLSKLWFIPILLFVGTVIVLVYFNFI